MGTHRRRGTYWLASGRTDRLQASPHLQLPEPQARAQPGRHGQSSERAASFGTGSHRSGRSQQTRLDPSPSEDEFDNVVVVDSHIAASEALIMSIDRKSTRLNSSHR